MVVLRAEAAALQLARTLVGGAGPVGGSRVLFSGVVGHEPLGKSAKEQQGLVSGVLLGPGKQQRLVLKSSDGKGEAKVAVRFRLPPGPGPAAGPLPTAVPSQVMGVGLHPTVQTGVGMLLSLGNLAAIKAKEVAGRAADAYRAQQAGQSYSQLPPPEAPVECSVLELSMDWRQLAAKLDLPVLG